MLRAQLGRTSRAGGELARLGIPNPTHKQGYRAADAVFEPRFPFTILALGFDGRNAFALLCYMYASEGWEVARLPPHFNTIVADGLAHFRDQAGSTVAFAALHALTHADLLTCNLAEQGRPERVHHLLSLALAEAVQWMVTNCIAQHEVGQALTATFAVTTLDHRRIVLQRPNNNNCIIVSAVNAAISIWYSNHTNSKQQRHPDDAIIRAAYSAATTAVNSYALTRTNSRMEVHCTQAAYRPGGAPTAACGKAFHAAMLHICPGVRASVEPVVNSIYSLGRCWKRVVERPTLLVDVAAAVCKLATSGPVILLVEAPTERVTYTPGISPDDQLHMVHMVVAGGTVTVLDGARTATSKQGLQVFRPLNGAREFAKDTLVAAIVAGMTTPVQTNDTAAHHCATAEAAVGVHGFGAVPVSVWVVTPSAMQQRSGPSPSGAGLHQPVVCASGDGCVRRGCALTGSDFTPTQLRKRPRQRCSACIYDSTQIRSVSKRPYYRERGFNHDVSDAEKGVEAERAKRRKSLSAELVGGAEPGPSLTTRLKCLRRTARAIRDLGGKTGLDDQQKQKLARKDAIEKEIDVLVRKKEANRAQSRLG